MRPLGEDSNTGSLLSNGPNPDTPWPVPRPILNDLPPVEPFDYALLPKSLAPCVEDIAERMQCPPDFVAVSVMVCISGAIGRRVAIEPKRLDDWIVYASVWGLCVGRPGLMKSPAIAEALKPLRRLEIEARTEYTSVMQEHEITAKAADLAATAAESKAKAAARKGDNAQVMDLLREAQGNIPDAPTQRRYITTNVTTEALAELLRLNPTGITLERDELAGLLRTMSKEGNEELRAFFLQGYDGASGFTFDRIGRGLDLHVPAVFISLIGAMQPGVLRSFIRDAMRGGGGDDGLLQRFGLLVWPDAPLTWSNVDRKPDFQKRERTFEVIRALSELGVGSFDDDGLPLVHVMKFDEAGQVVFDDWRAELENELRGEALLPAMESHLAKYRKLMPTLALLCALADGERQVVTERHALQGAAWCAYLRSHAARMYQAGSNTATEGARLLLRRIREGKLGEEFTARELRRRGWSLLSEADDVMEALTMLVDLGYLRANDVAPDVGRRTVLYQVNPLTYENQT